MIDFDKGIEKLSNYGGSERKGAVQYNGELYMIKFPDRARALKTKLSYINNQFSEYIGCHIFQSCGFETQETELGYYTDYKGERKIVVGCKDFTQDGSTLFEFSNLGKIIVGSDKKNATSLDCVDVIIEEHKLIKNKEEIREKFWDMFVVDALLGNKDRHLGNWGLLEKDGVIKYAPIYDCGSTLSALVEDESMKEMLSNPSEFKNQEFNVSSCYKAGGKKVIYHEIFKNPPKELKEAIKRTVPKINMENIHSIIESVEKISDVRKDYLKKSLDIRYEQILEPALNRILKQEKEIKNEKLQQMRLQQMKHRDLER